ncbi:MAG: hypothetical protein WBF52_14945 [Geitlerinemataceae cyanobacterium]
MTLTRMVFLGTRCLVLGCAFFQVATLPSAAQLRPDFNFLHIDPFEGFEELTIDPIKPISSTFEECLANPNATFVISRRGGLADDPTQTLRDRTLWRDLRPLEDTGERQTTEASIDEPEPINVEISQLENPDLLDVQNCQALFDRQ